MKLQLLKRSLIVALAIAMTACGQGMNSGASANHNPSQNGPISELPKIQFEEIEAQALEAEKAMAEAQATVENLVKDGRLNYSGESIELNSKGLSTKSLTGIPEKIGKLLDKVYNKLTLPVQKAKQVVEKSRAELVAALAQLDPANPLHQDLIKKLTEMMARLDGLENRFGGIYDILAMKVNVVVTGLDVIIAGMSSNPLLWIPMMELREVRDKVAAFRDKLANT